MTEPHPGLRDVVSLAKVLEILDEACAAADEAWDGKDGTPTQLAGAAIYEARDRVSGLGRELDPANAEVRKLRRSLEQIRDYAATATETSRFASVYRLRMSHLMGDAAEAVNRSKERHAA